MSKNRRALATALALSSISGVAHAGTGVWTTGGPYGGYIQAIAIDPANPANLYVAANNSGIFKSTNAGATWVVSAANVTFALAIHPAAPAVLYAGTIGGVYKSTDAGGTWSAATTGLTTPWVTSLAIDPATPATLFAGTSGGGVFKTTNSGATWTASSVGVTNPDIRTVVIDPVTPATIYTGTFGAGVFKSSDSGGTWAAASAGLTSLSVHALAIDPTAPGTLYAGTNTAAAFKSTNAGVTWTAASSGLASASVRALAIDATSPSTLYAGTNFAGLFKSTNSGGSWMAVNIGLTTMSVVALAIDPLSPDTVYAGTNTGAGVFKSVSAGESWTVANTGLVAVAVFDLAIDPAKSATLYAGTNCGVFKSTNAGGAWTTAASGLVDPVVRALVIDPAVASTLYAGTLQLGVFKSTNSGDTWVATNVGLSALSVFVLAMDPVTPGTLYAGTNGGGVFKSTNAGATWAAVNTGLSNLSVYAFAIDPITPATLYAGTNGGGVFKSTNSGTTWAAMNTGLTNLNAYAIIIDPATPATVYVGAFNGGVFKSLDGGGVWVAVNTGLTNLNLYAMTIDSVTPSTVYAGTRGGGVFKSTNSGSAWAPVNGGVTGPNIEALLLDPAGATTLYAGRFSTSVWQLTPDNVAPTNPTSLASTTHAPSAWTNVGSIGMQWSAADDSGGSGLAGYSVLFDTSAATVPDMTVDVPQSVDPHSTTSAPLPDGTSHYFHLRTCDVAGNCLEAIHRGPYWIDRTNPGAPGGLSSSSHTVGVPSRDPTIDVAWSASVDPLSGGVASGVDGYSVFWDGNAAPACDASKNVEESTLSATSAVLTSGTWYAHVCARDNAGNWSALSSAGPYTLLPFARGELSHGARLHGDLAANGGVPDEDLFRVRQQPFASYEVVMDETSGDIGLVQGPDFDRVAADGSTVVQASKEVGIGFSRSLRWMNSTGVIVDGESVRVRSASCTSDCGTDDVYRLRAWETTEEIVRFNNSASQVTVLVLQNPTSEAVTGRLLFWSTAGVLLHEEPVNLGPRASLNFNTSTISALVGQGGSITVMHDAPYGALAGKAVALEPATGFTFDSVMTPRQR